MSEEPKPIYLDVKEFTDNVEVKKDDTGNTIVTGTGILDVLMMTATKHLQAQFDNGNIRGEHQAAAYNQTFQVVTQAALQAWMQGTIASKQAELLEKQAETEEMKKYLYRRQIEGFDEDYKHKILKVMIDAWTVGFSVAKDSFEADGIPAAIQKISLDDLFNRFIIKDLDNYEYGRPWLKKESEETEE